MATYYEWDCEIIAAEDSEAHEAEEVLDHWHGESFAEVLRTYRSEPEPGTAHRIVLVRDDPVCRSWAYLDAGRLPEMFENADGNPWAKVPARFHVEVMRGLKIA